jgi:hypothetical protein
MLAWSTVIGVGLGTPAALAGCSCGDVPADVHSTDGPNIDTHTSTARPDTDTDAPAQSCPHVHFTEVDDQGSLDAAAQDLVAADLDGDGLPELVVARDRQPIVVFRNRGRGGGTAGRSFDVPIPIEGRNPVSMAVTDWNGDGLPDLVAVGSRVISFVNEGNLAFRQVNDDARPEPGWERIRVADMNGDGREDVIVYGGRGMAIYPAPDSDGAFGDPFSVDLGALGLRRGDVADLDGDGIPDLAVAAWGSDPFLLVAHGDGAGGFERITQHAVSEDMQSLEAMIVDVDADGVLDVVVVGHTRTELGTGDYVNREARLVWMRGLGEGQLEEAAVLELSPGAMGWTLAHASFGDDEAPRIVALAGGILVPEGENIEGAYHLLAYGTRDLEVVAPAFIEAGTAWGRILLDDMDGDGVPDFVRAIGSVSVRWGCPRQ